MRDTCHGSCTPYPVEGGSVREEYCKGPLPGYTRPGRTYVPPKNGGGTRTLAGAVCIQSSIISNGFRAKNKDFKIYFSHDLFSKRFDLSRKLPGETVLSWTEKPSASRQPTTQECIAAAYVGSPA